ncbi:MAG: bifunctional (p)ppGpp synthetase/guanosine-3',5'-bis(diphosphate) 3'-pyrophosphohydrolase [Pseudomonadota bacterium]
MVFVAHPITESGEAFNRDAWLDSLRAAYAASEIDLIAQALDMAVASASFSQALGTANVLAGLRMDYQTVAAALAAHAPLENEQQRTALKEQLGPDVARLVEGVSRMGQLHRAGMDVTLDEGKKTPVNQAESLRKMLLAMAEDVRVVLIVLADQVQLLRGWVKSSGPARARAAQEAQEIFAPLANRLGIWQIKWELEDVALRILEPALYKKMAKLLDERRVDREDYLTQVIAQLRGELADAGVQGEVSGRPKHIYSIWRKMKLKHLDFDQVYDVRAVRVLVHDLKDCYTVLGIVHGLWQPIPGEFDDYISHPKANDYRSLHTAVIGPEGRALEVQIRTFEMHQHAEFGVAAHWRYKEGAKASQGFDEKIAWLRQLLAWKDEVADAGEWVEQFKTELFQDRVYVLTPQGKVIDLPQGATPLDFAYALHSDLGHRCRGAKVDGSIVPLTYKLKNAQRIEILTAKQGQPSRDWLSPEYLATSRGRAKVRQWFNQQNFDEDLAQGRDILDRELHRLGVTGFNQDKLAAKFHVPRLEEFLAALGRGEITPNQTVLAIQDLADLKPKEAVPVAAPKRERVRAVKGDVIIEGVGSLQVSYGKCCKPVPPDAIVGYITQGRGVMLHRQDCGNVTRITDARRPRLLAASWNTGANVLHVVEIVVQAYDRQGLLRDISAALATEKVNVIGVKSETESGVADMRFTLEVRDLTQLNRVLLEIKKLSSVRLARRVG